MKKLLIAAVFLIASTLPAQTISPVVVESGRKVNGSFTVHNDTLGPLNVVIETMGSRYDEKGRHVVALDPSVHVTLSETSFRLGPQATEEIFYKGKIDNVPQSFVFLVEMTLGHTQTTADNQTVAVRLILPETVFVCQKASKCRENTLEAAGLLAKK